MGTFPSSRLTGRLMHWRACGLVRGRRPHPLMAAERGLYRSKAERLPYSSSPNFMKSAYIVVSPRTCKGHMESGDAQRRLREPDPFLRRCKLNAECAPSAVELITACWAPWYAKLSGPNWTTPRFPVPLFLPPGFTPGVHKRRCSPGAPGVPET